MSRVSESEREFEFALILSGVHEITSDTENALFEAGCDDATLSVLFGNLYLEFCRKSPTLKDAILSAIKDVQNAKIGATVWRVDACNLVTQAEIARRIGRSRQLVHQYMTGKRGPGGFPAPECSMSEGHPLWAWCDVSFWLSKNDMIRREELQNAAIIAAINNALEQSHQRQRDPMLVDEIHRALADR